MNNQPVDTHYEDRVRASFANQKFLKTLAATLGRIQPGDVEIEAPFKKKLTQQDGFLHAGVIAALVDTACGYAAYSLMPAGSRILSVEFKINMLSPAIGERFLARGRVIKSGKTLTVCEGKLYAYLADKKRLIAVMQATMICVYGGT
ncbi:MAG: PaaI family thioesterase [Anaerolineales bacterium]|jgi:uncharacterized protein (TIGR00369 family)